MSDHEAQPTNASRVRAVPKFYVTTPIYYVNDVPHIGHAYTTVTADAVARWHRLLGDDVYFLTGTDEHGLKVARAADEAGRSPQAHADATSARFRETWELLDISYDDFIRTTESRHHDAVQTFLQKVYDNGWIEKGTYAGWYCVACEAYYAEGDLVDGNCPIHGSPVEWLEEDNYFFKLSDFAQPLLDWYEANPDAVQPEGKRNEALGIIRQGLDDVSISRTSIDWGVPVPWDDQHVFYVWYDALDQLRDSDRLWQRHRTLRRMVADRSPPDRQGHPAVPLRVLARDAAGRGTRATASHSCARLLARRRRENEQDPAQPDLSGGSRR